MSQEKGSSAVLEGSREIVTTRLFDAPRELVFEAWTDPQHIGQWWGPNGFTTTTIEMNVKEGGIWKFVMHGPDGVDWENLIQYIEVVKPERLVFSHGDFSKEHFRSVVTFVEKGDQTELTLRSIFPTEAARDYVVKEVGAIEGAKQTLQRLAEYLANAR
jgi:uncharacterized protein YndB with AHSA1/START domain